MTNQEIYDLIARFENSSLDVIKLSRENFSLELRKGGSAPACAAPAVIPAAATVPSAAPVPGADNSPTITAPLVGTYYAAPSPEAEPFVRVGGKVEKGQTVCLIEAMKMISEIPAPCDCVITEILKENGSLAAFDEPLFRYQPC